MSTLTGELNIVQNLTGEINKNLEYVTPELQEKTITPTKQIQNVMPDENYDALSKVVVNPIPNEYIIPNFQTKNITIVQNGVQEITPDVNYDGLNKVNVTTSIPAPVLPNGIKFKESTANNFDWLENVDTSSITDFSNMFTSCSNMTSMGSIDTSNGTTFKEMFMQAGLTEVPQLDTSNGKNFYRTFQYCSNLKTIPLLDLGEAINIQNIVFSFEITTLGGFKDLGKAYSITASSNNSYYTLNLSTCSKLTHDSLMNVINNLYDIASKGVPTQQLVLGSTNLEKLTEEEIAIATNKGWTVS